MVKTTNYQNGKIYKVVDKSYEMCYIGSTIDTLPNRFKGHKTHYNQYLQGNKLRFTSVFDMFDKYGIENCKIELIEKYPCDDITELQRREGHFIKTTDCINKNIAGRSASERYNDNPDYYKEKSKTYYNNNKDGKIKEYIEEHWEHLCEIKRQNYYNKKDYYREQNKEYLERNADKVYARRSKKITCECGAVISYGYKSQHLKTKAHQEFKRNQEQK